MRKPELLLISRLFVESVVDGSTGEGSDAMVALELAGCSAEEALVSDGSEADEVAATGPLEVVDVLGCL